MTRESPREYAQRRANETRRAYGVYQNPEAPEYVYSAAYCRHNVRTYADIGATDVTIIRPSTEGGAS